MAHCFVFCMCGKTLSLIVAECILGFKICIPEVTFLWWFLTNICSFLCLYSGLCVTTSNNDKAILNLVVLCFIVRITSVLQVCNSVGRVDMATNGCYRNLFGAWCSVLLWISSVPYDCCGWYRIWPRQMDGCLASGNTNVSSVVSSHNELSDLWWVHGF